MTAEVEQRMTDLVPMTSIDDASQHEGTVRYPNVLLFVEGVVSISLQLLVIRQLVPFVGSSINVTSIVITVFLAALAAGYWTGGRSVSPGRATTRCLVWLCLGIPVLFSHPFISLFFSAAYGLQLPPLIVTAVYCVICLGPVVYLFGQFVVLLVNFKTGVGAASRAGDTFYVSTIGNVVGGLLTTLVIMYYFGVAVALACMTGLMCLGVWISGLERLKKIATILAALGIAGMGIADEYLSFLRTTAYANYYVAEDNDARFLVVNGQNASRTDGRGVGHGYVEWMEDRLEKLSDHNRPLQVLVLGAGGFTLGRGRTLNADWRFVDVDAHLPVIADQFLEVSVEPGVFESADARAWLTIGCVTIFKNYSKHQCEQVVRWLTQQSPQKEGQSKNSILYSTI